MRGRALLRTLAIVGGIALIACASAYAITMRAGNLVVTGDGGFAPRSLPKYELAPIKFFMHGSIRTIDGTRPSPLRTMVLELDRNGAPETRGLPKCSRGRLVATTTRQARALCPGSIIGTGYGTAVVELPDQRPIWASSPITIFNGPERNGNMTAIGHAHLDYPTPTTYVVSAEVERVNHGRYGYRIVVDFPKIANDYGSGVYGRISVDRKWQYKGRTLSIANARCPDGRLQARVQLRFKDDTFLQGSAFKRCTVRR